MKLVQSIRNVIVKVIMNTGILTVYSKTKTIPCIRKIHDYRIRYQYSKIVFEYKYSRISNTITPGLLEGVGLYDSQAFVCFVCVTLFLS